MHYTLTYCGTCISDFFHCVSCPTYASPVLSFKGLIYKEVSEWEEWTKNGVIRGQPPPLGE